MRGSVVVFVLFWSSSAFGQSNPAPAMNFRADSNLVVIPVSVTDNVNRFVLGLRKDDFKLFDNGVEQPLVHFSGDDVPLSIGLAFDISGSMDYKMRTSRDATVTMLKTMSPEDEALLVEFNDKADLTVGFTSKPQEIREALQKVQPTGLTALLDALKFALTEMKNAKNPRKAIIVVSDGGDNSSKYTPAEIEALVREADVQIYAMGVFDPLASLALTPEEVSGPRLLSEIATQTGFEDEHYFSRLFRQKLNATPSQWRSRSRRHQ